jgi:hypothetical protein
VSHKSLNSLSFYNVEVLAEDEERTYDYTVSSENASALDMEGADEIESVDDVIDEMLDDDLQYHYYIITKDGGVQENKLARYGRRRRNRGR